MKRRLAFVLVCLLAAAAMAGTAFGAPARSANCAGLCLSASASSGWSFSGQFQMRRAASADKPWLRLSNRVSWTLTLPSALRQGRVTAEVHLGTPGRPAGLVVVLCAHCNTGARGVLRLSDAQLGRIFAGVPLGAGKPIRAYLLLRTPDGNLLGRLTDW